MSEYINKVKDQILVEINNMATFEGTEQDYIVSVWKLRNKARRICNKLGNQELQKKVEGLLTPDQQFLFDLLDSIYEIGYRDGLGY